MDIATLLLPQRPTDDTFLTLAFGPGVIRFLGLKELKRSNADKLDAELRELLTTSAHNQWQFLDWGKPVHLPRAVHYFGGRWSADYRFLENEYFYPSCFIAGIRSIKVACDVFETVVNELLESPFPSISYWMFSDLLKLGDLRLREFRESWCPSAWRDDAIVKTYQGLNEYFVVTNDGKYTQGNIVFKRTPFFNDRMYIKHRMENRKLATTDQATLAGASYGTYVYLMEDLRNCSVKIGKSTSPRKRERTLQSEEPNIHLRLAVPCEDNVEKELHHEFAAKRIRGEWFQLDSTELLDLVSRLTKIGDAERLIADYSWIGRLFIHGGMTLVKSSSHCGVVGTSVDKLSSEEIFARVHDKLDAKNFDDAIHDLDELIRRDGRSGDLYLIRAKAECSLGNFTRALFDINDSIRLQSESAVLLCLRGKIKFKLHDYESAMCDFDQSLRLNPKSADALYARGTLKCKSLDYLGALQDLNNSISLRTSSAVTFHSRGIAHAACGNLVEAMRDYMEAIRLDSHFAEAFVGLGIAKHMNSDFSGALHEFDHALTLEPGHANAKVNKAFLMAVANNKVVLDARQANDLASSVLSLQPENAYALNAKACALAALGEFPSAIDFEMRALLNNDWAQDHGIDGGVCAQERIDHWETGSLWKPKTR